MITAVGGMITATLLPCAEAQHAFLDLCVPIDDTDPIPPGRNEDAIVSLSSKDESIQFQSRKAWHPRMAGRIQLADITQVIDADKAERLFELALEHSPAQRDAFLDDACSGDPDLRRELASLLPYAEADPDFLAIPVLQRPVPDLVGLFGDGDGKDATPTQGDSPPEEIGGYRLVRLLGCGAMAMVYEARQQNSERSVALKLLCPGPLTPGLKRRFNSEARLLGRLRHPGIAQIFEAGLQELTDPRGGVYHLPFLVMELVSGCRLDAYVSRADLSLEDRLRLFAKICDAVEYAHRQGVLHRDLKPANILVEDNGQPKIVDFGIARAIASDAGGADAEPSTQLTATGQILGSLAYMSPEQLEDSHHVDARSDVYALGVILYQVLAGRLPYEVSRLSVAEAALLIGRAEAVLPPLGPPRGTVSLGTFDRAYHGDLRTITSKAMAKDRSRRYDSAAQLAADVRRHLEHLPIHARPASFGYRLGNFVRRKPATVYGLVAGFLVLALGAAVAFLGLRLTRKSRGNADSS